MDPMRSKINLNECGHMDVDAMIPRDRGYELSYLLSRGIINEIKILLL